MVLEKGKDIKLCKVDKSSLAELSSVLVRKNERQELDLENLGKQTPNLYLYRVGDVVVEFDYLPNGRSMNDLFALMVQTGI